MDQSLRQLLLQMPLLLQLLPARPQQMQLLAQQVLQLTRQQQQVERQGKVPPLKVCAANLHCYTTAAVASSCLLTSPATCTAIPALAATQA